MDCVTHNNDKIFPATMSLASYNACQGKYLMPVIISGIHVALSAKFMHAIDHAISSWLGVKKK